MQQYLDMLYHILSKGTGKEDRTGVGTISTFGYQTRFDLSEGFPLVTVKRTPFRIIAEELLWFISGSDNIRPLLEKNVHIWDEWGFKTWYESEEYSNQNRPKFDGLGAKVPEEQLELYNIEMKHYQDMVLSDTEFADKYGCLNRVYGAQWRNWANSSKIEYIKTTSINACDNAGFIDDTRSCISTEVKYYPIDQLQDVINRIKSNPDDRRLIVSAWNPSEIPDMALPPCHSFFQFYVKDGKLSCQLYQRSADTFLGVPFNIASYALLTHLVAHVCDLEVGDFVHTFGDLHLYTNQLDATEQILARKPMKLPKLKFNRKVTNIDDFTIEDFEIVGYESHPPIRVEVAV